MRTPSLRGALAPALLTLLGLGACGGGGGGDGPGPMGPNNAPTLTVSAPALGVAGLAGDSFRFSFTSNDDNIAAVTLVADADLNAGTTGDQTPLFAGVDANGAITNVVVPIPALLAVGDYLLIATINDGTNPAVSVVLPRPLVVYPGIAGVNPPRSNRYGVSGNTIVFSRGEAEDAAGPLNGDGLADDGVMVTFNAQTGVLTQPAPSVSMDCTQVVAGQPRPVTSDANVLSWLTREADENANRNGANIQSPNAPIGGADADQLDVFVSYLAPGISLNPVTNTYAGPAVIADVIGGMILSRYLEAPEGAGGTDRNTDGDSQDAVFGYVDPSVLFAPFEYNQVVFFSPPALNAPAGPARHRGPTFVAFRASEIGAPGGTDLNGDADSFDTFLQLGSFQQLGGNGLPGQFLGLAGFQPAPAQPPQPVDPAAAFDVSISRHVGYYALELADNRAPGGLAGNDLNGDGVIGRVALIYDQVANLQLLPIGAGGPINSIPGCPDLVYDNTRVFFTGIEAPRAEPAVGTNLDGDALDLQILYWMDHTAGPNPPAQPVPVAFGGGIPLQALALDQGGSVTQLAPGWLAVIVNEQANGNFDINGSGAVDFAYLLVDTSTNPNPTVHNPQIVPSAAGTIPLTGIYGQDAGNADQGVFVRLAEAQNGDLDGDMNATETFIAYISFTAPTVVVRFDTGGDHLAVADGRVAITASEAFTGSDFDGNGSFTNFVFRVLNFAGAALEPGKLCAQLSVPVTESGQVFVYLRDESVEARNLNADGDQTDRILGIWIP